MCRVGTVLILARTCQLSAQDEDLQSNLEPKLILDAEVHRLWSIAWCQIYFHAQHR